MPYRAVDQRLSCCPTPFKTIRTARSRTSGVYLFVVLFMMLHSTHELEPPANPARVWMPPILQTDFWRFGRASIGRVSGLLVRLI